jgi:primosomal protein N'
VADSRSESDCTRGVSAPHDKPISAKQAAVLDLLRRIGKPIEQRQLMRQAKCGSSPVEALINKGLARRVARRVDRFVDSTHEEPAPAGPISLNGAQLGVWSRP